MSKTNLKMEDRRNLLYHCGGLCSICRDSLDYDRFSRLRIDIAEYAHIIADSKNGPRGNPKKSSLYAGDINNIILLCPSCHTKVDKNLLHYTEEYLHIIKAKHIEEVRRQLNALKNTEAFIVKYEAPIGNRIIKIDEEKIGIAVVNSGFICHEIPISLNPNNTAYTDRDAGFWESELNQLRQNYKNEIEARLKRENTKPFLLFAIAPQPLLVMLGTLMNDTLDVHVFQKRREPDTWEWDDSFVKQEIRINCPQKKHEEVAVKLSLSDTISDDRITALLGPDISIWEITHSNPHNDFLKHPDQLAELRKTYRKFFQLVREFHGQNIEIHAFLAAPVSAAIEFGRAWMPKADANIKLYDQNKVDGDNKFEYAFSLPSC